MKKKGLIALLMTGLLLTGCSGGSLEAGEFDENTLILSKKGTVLCGIAESFEKDYYDAQELKAFAQECIESYNTQQGEDRVELSSFEAEEKKASMVVSYQAVEDYAAVNSTVAGLVTYEEAKSQGLIPDTLINMSDGSTVAATDVEAEEGKVFFLSEECDVTVEGKILYYSNSALKSNDSVHTAGNGTAIIIFK